jgi:predicted ester cyclase
VLVPWHGAAETVPVDSNEQSADADRLDPAAVYRRFLDALNRQDLTEAETCVDPTRYRENCVGFTDGYVNWADAKTSVQTIWKGLPDLHVELHDLATGPDLAIARGTVSGTALGRLDAPAVRTRARRRWGQRHAAPPAPARPRDPIRLMLSLYHRSSLIGRC